ncbi:hypothetical protein [Cellulomonas denverensis]|uniref:hypothetical protein n=1 Tax=Cellulomonas denverensis TaxID=264297 RepID=UPI0035E468D6
MNGRELPVVEGFAGVAVIGLVVLAAIGTLRGTKRLGEHSVYTLAIWPLLVIAVLNLRPMSAMLSWRPFAYLGSLSCDLHVPLPSAARLRDARLGSRLEPQLQLTPGVRGVVGTFAVAALAHKFLEMPAQRWLRSVTAAGAASEPRRTRRH